jgi:5-methylthioadenosine/S-adenosylhomocysteine deaminase
LGIILKNVVAGADKAAKVIQLRIEGATISAISEEELPLRPDETVIDGGGKLVLPGFVNAHTHLPMVLVRGLADDLLLRVWLEEHIWPIEKDLSPEDVYWGTLFGLAEMIRGGTTTCADMYFHTDAIGRAVEEVGVRALLSCGIIAGRLDVHGKREMKKAEEAITHWEGAANGRIRTAISPHAIYTCGETVWHAAIDLAGKYAVPLHTHLAESAEETEWCQENLGLRPVPALDRIGAFSIPTASIPTLVAHCVQVDEEDIKLLAEREVTVIHCPKSNAKLGNGIAPLAAMRAAGVRIALGTDGAATNNSLDMIEEMRMATLLGKGIEEDPTALPASDVVEMATRGGAEALGMGAKRLAVGEPADLVLIDLDSIRTLPAYDPFSALVYAAHAEDVTDVIVAGRFLLKDKELLTIDEERVKHEVKRIAKRYGN